MAETRILVVDDEENVRISLRGVLQDEGYRVECSASAEECMKQLERRDFDLVLLDVWLPGMDGLQALQEIRRLKPHQSVIMISGHGTIETAVQATKRGAFDFIEKPLTTEKVLLAIDHALQHQRLQTENRNLRRLLQQETNMIGHSVPMQALRQQIEYAAPTEGRILIYGENGTGKELVSRLLHLKSHRREQPFIDVNCAAIPEDLIESELFGSVKGAYTGAEQSRMGKFEQAHGGTLFLDEVGDMSLKTQAKVLRVLEEQRFHPVGSTEAVEVDVRVIAATNKDLESEIERGAFRQDLFFRLNVIPFEVPALRDRREDVPLLLDYFLELFCRRYGKPVKELGAEALKRLTAYDWPGNVRELKNLVERLVIMVPDEQISASDLPATVCNGRPEGPEDADSWQQARERFEKKFILEKLMEHGGNISRTAEAIGIERTHLHRKLKSYKIKSEPRGSKG